MVTSLPLLLTQPPPIPRIDTFNISPRRKQSGPRALFLLLLGVALFGTRNAFVVAANQNVGNFTLLVPPSNSTNATLTLPSNTTSPPPSLSPSAMSSSKMPAPFDNTPSSAFKAVGSGNSCPKFISNLLSNSTFQSCYPISMMLQTSNSFFQTEKSLVDITRVLDAACKANSASCINFLNAVAANLTSSKACKKELEQNLTPVTQAYHGLKAYNVLYAATCLQSPDTNQYCFAEAVTNPDAPSSNYLYFLPYGLALPSDARPSCGWCTQQTMALYNAAAANRQAFVSDVYKPAAEQLNLLCGSRFVETALPPAVSLATFTSPVHLTLLTVLWAAFALV